MTALRARLEAVARVPALLVATDYDGTISPIVDDPARARPHPEAIESLRRLAALPRTHVAVISGRALAELAALTGLAEQVHLVGSHGGEFDPGYAAGLPPEKRDLRQRVADELTEIAAAARGLELEHKPAGVALHYRRASAEDAQRAFSAASAGPGAIEGVFTRHGKKVLELSVAAANKGDALETVRRRCGASATVFLGDDVTDEDAFARLGGSDVGIKVGPGASIAQLRIEGTGEVAGVLARLGALRAAWLEEAPAG